MKFFSALLSLFFFATTAFAEELPNDVRARLMRPCQQITGQNKERCEQRQLQRWKVQESHKPDQAFETYDGMDMGKARLRRQLNQERETDNKRHWAQNRRTYRELQPTDDLNTTRRPFLNDYRVKRLACMTEHLPDRARTRCMDRLENELRQNMKDVPLPEPKPYQY